MSGDRWQRVREVFEEAFRHAPEQRPLFLAQACGDDADLRSEVASLLEQERHVSDEFMQPPRPHHPIEGDQPCGRAESLIGQWIGRYHIEAVIASGGMGTVYRAVQEHPRRPVALKVMSAGITSRSALRRFEYESQILAHLRHPNIAQVYEAGMHPADPSPKRQRGDTPDDPIQKRQRGEPPDDPSPKRQRGDTSDEVVPTRHRGDGSADAVPYFAMEFIPDAKPITDYADAQGLSTRQRLELFAQVCAAVHHGHQKGIIHRDLKPANILVDSAGQVKVIDFGVARATDSDLALTTLHTSPGDLIGTLQYMSPEQCAAEPFELDTRSDVYSLGVVLYELVCKQLPYDVSGTTIFQAARVIREEPPATPSALDRQLRGDMEAVLLTTLAKDRLRRYQTAAELEQDIRRYLGGEPILARPPTAFTRAIRWASRHPVLTAMAASSIGTSAIVATVMLTISWYINVNPHSIDLSEDRTKVELRSLSGDAVYTWPLEGPGNITFAQMVRRPAEMGAGELALIGYNADGNDSNPGSLCAYEIERDLATPIWVGRIQASDLPKSLRLSADVRQKQFGVHWCRLIDIFDEVPGAEIVVVYSSAYSPRAIRIYDLQGRLLNQMWHDGTLGESLYWMGEVRLLVFVGMNSKVYWEGRGQEGLTQPYPSVVFAIRPERGFVTREFLGLEPEDDPTNVAWYKCVLPPAAADVVHKYRLEPPWRPHDAGRSAQWVLYSKDQAGPSVGWILDESGELVPETQTANDEYKLNRLKLPEGDPRRLPDPDLFELGTLPPILSTADRNSSPSVE